jgi:uncharacterized membrane protein
MSEVKNYSLLTLEELSMEQKKLKNQHLLSAGMIGFFIGIIIFGLFKKGFGWVFISISVFMIYLINKNFKSLKQNLEQIKEEIEKRK